MTQAQSTGQCILIVEDDAEMRESLGELPKPVDRSALLATVARCC
jgi:hypothetical protein